MNIERLVYSNRLWQIPAAIQGLLSFRPTLALSSLRNLWQEVGKSQKLKLVALGVFLVIGVFSLVVKTVASSQAAFFNRFAPAGVFASATTTSTKPKRESAPKTLPPFTDIATEANDYQVLARGMSAVRFGDQHWESLLKLWNAESGWNPDARNRSSGACGIPQAYPCHKIPDLSPEGQIQWGLDYIAARYGNPTNAWHFWQSHHWY